MSSAEINLELEQTLSLSPVFVRPWRKFASYLSSGDLAMDLGTANTLIYMKGRGIILNQPSVVAIDEQTRKIVAVGHEAKDMLGKTSRAIRCFRPMKEGVIADFEMTTVIVRYMLAQVVSRWRLFSPRIVIGVPSGITQVEKKAVVDSAMLCGMGSVRLVEEPMAAALGSGLPVDRAVGNMVVDIGGGTTEVAILSLNEAVYSHSIRVAGDVMDEAIQRYLKRVHGLEISISEAERIKVLIGSALPFGKVRTVAVCGKDLSNMRPTRVEVTDQRIREALNEPIAAIISSVSAALEQVNTDMARDIVARGIHLAGGGSLLKGLAERLQRETGIRFHLTHDPLSAVVRGAGKIAENYSEFKCLCIA